jgi:hypothetical protein
MRWIMRHAVFSLCLSLGTAAWYILAQKESTPAQSIQVAEETPIVQTNAPAECEQPENAPGQSIKFGLVEPMNGYTNAKIITLRESADASSKVVAKLKAEDYGQILILGATRDYLYVRVTVNDVAGDDAAEAKEEYEGWAAWGSVVTDMSAIVMDAETGEVVSRVPFGDTVVSSVIFSPDNSRAIFFSGGSRHLAYEVRTSDYTLTRSLTTSDEEYLGTLFYGPADDALYATVHWSGNSSTTKRKVSVVRIDDDGASNVAPEFKINESNFVISPDGLLAFVQRAEGENNGELTIDVIELATQTLRNTFTLAGANVSSNVGSIVLSRDGSELYERLSENTGAISVVDTRTGQVVRELPASSTQSWSYFTQGDVVGDSLLLRVYEGGEEEMHASPRRYWVGNYGRVEAEGDIASAIEAGGKRYAVNENGTRLFRLDDKNRIREKFTITRPDLRTGGEMGSSLTVFGLSASPDGKRIIMLIGMEHGC